MPWRASPVSHTRGMRPSLYGLLIASGSLAGQRMARAGRKANGKGRSEGQSRFLQLPFWVMEAPAFHYLSPEGRTALLYLLKRFDGRNNGKIGFGVRSGGFVRNAGCPDLVDKPVMSQTRMQAALYELQAFRLARISSPSSFGQKKRAREWELTWLPCDGKAATRDFMTLTERQCQLIGASLKTKPRSAGRNTNACTGPPAEHGEGPNGANPSLQVRPQTYEPNSQVRRQTTSNNHIGGAAVVPLRRVATDAV